MDQTFGHDSAPASGSFDKSRVLDVRPLRRLVPVFPSPSNMPSFPTPGAPFISAPPTGPFPPGVAPFYPFFGSAEPPRPPNVYSNTISDAVPINSFRTPAPAPRGVQVNGDTGPSKSTRSRFQSPPQSGFSEDDGFDSQSLNMNDVEGTTSNSGRTRKRSSRGTKGSGDVAEASPEVDTDLILTNVLTSFNAADIDAARKTDGDSESVAFVLLIFDLFRRKISQLEDAREIHGISKRADLRGGAVLLNKGIRTNSKKRIGTVPGIEIGDIFFFRMELCLVGLHAPSMAGIDYMTFKGNQDEEPLAVSIVSSGGYEDNVEDADVLIYSGSGGNVNKNNKEVMDQKLERGNLALEKSLHRGNEIRVTRGMKDANNPTSKIYVYDGLYKIQESWVEKGKSGCNVFKYKLGRLPGQPPAFSIWKSVQQWKESITSRVGVILPDLTSGAEKIPVSLVNDVDDEKGPQYFNYLSSLKYLKPVNSVDSIACCSCTGGCLPGNRLCLCAQKNDGYLPYTGNGIIVDQKSLTYECGSSCPCPSNCKNRVSQGGLKVHLEVFKTRNKGWGLRSWDPIRGGTFICEYAGEVIDVSKMEELRGDNEDDYVFDATRIYQSVESVSGDTNWAPKIPFPLAISAKSVGNVARFMNHSCSPNVLWKPVLRENNKGYEVHIAFYAIRHIPPMTELTYDYGRSEKSERRKHCLCGSTKCRGYFF